MESTSAETGAVNSRLGLGYLVRVTSRESVEFSLIAPRTPVNENLASHLAFSHQTFRVSTKR